MRFPFLSVILLGIICLIGFPIQSQTQALTNTKTSFINWAKANYVPLQLNPNKPDTNFLNALGKSIGDARVVAISEGFHNCEEMLQLQIDIIRYLVKEKGFNIVMSESGLPESKHINNYIHGEQALPNLYDVALGRLYAEWETGRNLIEWLRQYNSSQNKASQVDYIGSDIGGFYKNWIPPFEIIFKYLEKVDSNYNSTLKAALNPFLNRLRDNARIEYFNSFSDRDRLELMLQLNKLVKHFGEHSNTYIEKSNKADFEFTFQAAKSMLLAANYYNNIIDNRDPYVKRYAGLNGRELAMSANVKWALTTREDAKIIWINHVVHTKTEMQYQETIYRFFTPAGAYLKQELGNDYYAIGMLYGSGQFWKNWTTPGERFISDIPAFSKDGIEQTMANIHEGSFFIPWQKVTNAGKNWLNTQQHIRENTYNLKLRPNEWNSCIYLHTVSPATPAKK